LETLQTLHSCEAVWWACHRPWKQFVCSGMAWKQESEEVKSLQ
jgi:hypothetical protein